MFLLKILGAVFVSLILFMPEYLPKDAFGACCGCTTKCSRGCTCGCGCGDATGKMACITRIDTDKNLVRLVDKSTNEEFELPYLGDLFDQKKVGDCGMIKTKKEDVQVCTGFATQKSVSQQKEMHDLPMSK